MGKHCLDARVLVGMKSGGAQRRRGEAGLGEGWPLSLSTKTLPLLPDTKKLG